MKSTNNTTDWISVNDKLPEMIYDEGYNENISIYVLVQCEWRDGSKSLKIATLEQYDDEKPKWYDNSREHIELEDSYITHWRNLPNTI